MARTLLDKLWDSHVVLQEPGCPAVLSIDLHLIHEVTSPQAFTELAKRGLSVRRPDRTFATMDHSTPTLPGGLATADAEAKAQLKTLEDNCGAADIELHALGTPKQGIVHVMGPELGLTQPGMTVVCGDSHTSTHGAFGALAFGIGTSEVGHVLATQCMLLRKPKSFLVKFEGSAGTGVTAKDLILGLIAKIGVGGGTGHVFEYAGEAIRDLDMEGRMTVCNMSIEAGARAGLIAPDEKTFAWLKGREKAPQGAAWDEAVARWKELPSDEGAVYDREITIDVAALEPMITFGTNPGMGIGITSPIPSPESLDTQDKRDGLNKALTYMGLKAGDPIIGHPVDVVFIGSCTNSRLPDLNAAATIFRGRKVKEGVRVLIVPGSMEVKRIAEEAGLHTVFTDAGAEWREPGCSMCIAMNGDMVGPGQVAVSTSNRNFEGRQGKGSRTLLASPLTAAASAVTGVVTDPRTLI